jgi:hypothetical protein
LGNSATVITMNAVDKSDQVSYVSGTVHFLDVCVGRAAPCVAPSLQKRGPRPHPSGRRGRLPNQSATPCRVSLTTVSHYMNVLDAVALPMITPRMAREKMAKLVLAVGLGRARGVRAMVRLGGMAMALMDTGNGQRTQAATRTIAGEMMNGKAMLRSPGPSSFVSSAGGLGASSGSAARGLIALADNLRRRMAPDVAARVIVGADTTYQDEDCADYSTAGDGEDREVNSGIVNTALRTGIDGIVTSPNCAYTIEALSRAAVPSARWPW